MRVGVFGGTFDPPHNGHLAVAQAVRDKFALDLLLFVVSNDPWQKTAINEVTPAEMRLAMVEAALHRERAMQASRLEIDRGGPSYMVDTLSALHAADPEADLFLIVGADTAAGLSGWERAERLPELAQLVILSRPGVDIPPLDPEWFTHVLDDQEYDVSSSDIRARVAAGKPIEHLVSDSVARLIFRHHLYRSQEIGQ